MRLKRLASDLAVLERVKFLGFIDSAEHEQFFRSIDVLCLPSAYECFGMAAAEALVEGIPVVASDRTGIAEVIGRHGCGLVTEASTEALTAALAQLAIQPCQVREMSELAIEAAAAKLSYTAHAERLIDLYADVLATNRSGPCDWE